MDGNETGPGAPRNQLADEAAEWFARMRGPDAHASRDAFERWLQRGALHRAAYNRVAEIFAMGKALKAPPPRKSVPRWPLVPAALFLAGLGAWLFHQPNLSSLPTRAGAPMPATGQISTALGVIRPFRLADGSTVTLDTDSLVTFSMDGARRSLRLLRGRARFSVAHDGRPFRVEAGNGAVTARGTIFDVQLLRSDQVVVRLLRGKVDVSLSQETARGEPVAVRRLTPGATLVFATQFLPAPSQTAAMNAQWPSGVIDATAMPLEAVLAEANRYGPIRLVAGSADVAALRVTGRFAVDAPEALARRLAILFDLAIDRQEPDRWILARRPIKKNSLAL